MEEVIKGKTHTVIPSEQMTDIGMRMPVTFTVNSKKMVSTLNGRIEQEKTHSVEE